VIRRGWYFTKVETVATYVFLKDQSGLEAVKNYQLDQGTNFCGWSDPVRLQA
jgi:hypothetical protein